METLIFVLFVLRSSVDRLFEAMRIEVAGMDMTAGAILNLAVLGLTALLILRRSGSAWYSFRIWLPFLAVAAASIAWSSDKTGGIRALLVLLTYACLFAIPFLVGSASRHSAYLLKAVVYSSIVPAVLGVLELIFFRDPSGRVQSTFIHPNGFAFYLMVVLGVIFFLLSSSAIQFRPVARRLMLPYAGLLLGLLIMTQTRSAWIGTFIILMAYATLINRRYLLALPLLPLLLFIPAVGDRLADLEHGTAYTGAMGSKADALNSFAWRELMWESAFADVAESPVFGKGLASFAPNSLVFFPLADATKKSYYRGGIGAHSAYVQTFYETGAVGFTCYLLIYLSLLVRIARSFRKDPRGAIMLGATVVAYMVGNFSDNILDYGSLNLYFWGFAGIVCAKWAQLRPAFVLPPSPAALRSRLAYRQRFGDLRPSA
ncbi:MAG: O-antigen ligase family protein [Pseudolabrys sp.]